MNVGRGAGRKERQKSKDKKRFLYVIYTSEDRRLSPLVIEAGAP